MERLFKKQFLFLIILKQTIDKQLFRISIIFSKNFEKDKRSPQK